ncbi:MAG: hypothetical protein J3K34DRAFT_434709 [Monoraphidium minutum]|nr:MAG: hypothetical protein J3K34DRAFT_434709 [Monoraphidium minutum]
MMQLASWLVPDAHHNYWALFTSLAVLGMAFAFAFMAGDYATWQRTPAAAAALGGVPPAAADAARWGPGVLAQWLRFWRLGPQTTFNPVYLYAWGARYMPAVKAGQWWRLFSSFCLHNSFTHLLTNMALFVLLTVPLEHTYGPLRIGLIFLASAFGANFLSMTFEDPCVIYVGASGAVFGFVGLAISDLLLNWDTVSAPVVRLLVMLAMLGISIAVEYMEVPLMAAGKVSHLSHIGGLLGGLFVSFAFLPNLKDRRFRAMRRFAKRTWGHRLPRAAPREHKSCWRANRWLYWLCMAACGAAVLFLYVALPVWIWVWKLPRLECPVVLGIP